MICLPKLAKQYVSHLPPNLAADFRKCKKKKQHGTEDCPSSDTLLLAWALMESKIHNARARKTAWALLRRAVALNPKKHSKVLKWTMFTRDLDWVEAAGGAAVQAVRSALSPAVAVTGASTSVSNETVERREKASTSRAQAKRETEIATELQALCHSKEALLREQEMQAEAGGNESIPPFPYSSSPHGGMPVPAASPTTAATALAPSARFQELAGELEKVGGGAEGGVRALSGTWRLVFTTCKECDRVLVRTGAFSIPYLGTFCFVFLSFFVITAVIVPIRPLLAI